MKNLVSVISCNKRAVAVANADAVICTFSYSFLFSFLFFVSIMINSSLWGMWSALQDGLMSCCVNQGMVHSPYWSALDFWKIVFELSLDELDFFLILNWIFTACVAWKNQVWNRPKIKFVLLDSSKIKCRSTGGLCTKAEYLCNLWIHVHSSTKSFQGRRHNVAIAKNNCLFSK